MSELQLAMCVNVGSLTVESEAGNEDSFKRETESRYNENLSCFCYFPQKVKSIVG